MRGTVRLLAFLDSVGNLWSEASVGYLCPECDCTYKSVLQSIEYVM